jgi:anti-sigma28 factor (negative regulator of flagellin synthesis)
MQHAQDRCGARSPREQDQIMKIDSNRAELETTPAAKLAATRTSELKAGAKAHPSATDHVSVSGDAKLASKAIEAAAKASDIRPEVVARAKALLASGKVGNDPHRLADAIILGLLGNQ